MDFQRIIHNMLIKKNCPDYANSGQLDEKNNNLIQFCTLNYTICRPVFILSFSNKITTCSGCIEYIALYVVSFDQ